MRKLFALVLLFFAAGVATAQQIPYGSNAAAGKTLLAEGNATLYYEVYGEGSPLLLLHGDTYGYIDEFEQYIPLLSKHFRVIAIGMRGHGRSQLGNIPFSYKLLAEDALAILRKESSDSATVVGFSCGAILAYYLAAYYPGSVRKIVALGGILNKSDYRPGTLDKLNQLTLADMEKQVPGLVRSREQIMPQPERYAELLERLKAIWNADVYVDPEKAKAIKCPVLVVGGDRDPYCDVSRIMEIYKMIPGSQLAIIPNCGHVGLITKPEMFSAIVTPFLADKK